MPTVEVSVAADASDGFAVIGDDIYPLINEVGTNSGLAYHCWLHFANVTVPQGASINVAYLIMERKSYGYGTVLANIYAVDEDTHAAPTNLSEWTTDHGIHTTASVAWDFAPAETGAQNSPSIVTVIQEIVNRASWASGNDIGIHIDDDTTGGTNIYQEWEDTVDGTAPTLHIEYTDGIPVYPDVATSLVTAYAPTVAPGAVTVSPDVASATITAYAPTIDLVFVIAPDVATSLVTAHPPVVTGGVTYATSVANPFLDAEAFWRASEYSGTGDLIDLTGNGHDAQLGSTAGADSNDPTFLAHDGTNYAWADGSSGTNLLDGVGALTSITPVNRVEYICKVQLPTYTPAALVGLMGDGTGGEHMRIDSNGKIVGRVTDTVSIRDGTSASAISASGGTDTWLRMIADETTPGWEFYESTDTTNDPDAVTWSSLGSAGLVAGTLVGFDDLEVLTRGNGNSPMEGRLYVASVRYDGVEVARLVPSDIEPSRTALDLDGTGDYASVPDEDALDITGDIEAIWYGALDDYTSGANQVLLSKWNTVGNQRSWAWRVRAAGAFRVHVSTTGSDAISLDTSAAVPFGNGTAHWLKMTYSSSDRVVSIYSSDDGETWGLIEATAAGAAAAPFASTAELRIGAGENAGAIHEPATGQFHRAIVKDGIGGTTVLDVDFTDQIPGAATITAETGQTVTLVADAAVVPDGQLRIHDSTPTYLDGPGATGDFASIPSTVQLCDFGGGAFTVEMLGLVVADTTPAANGALITKDASSNRSWGIYLQPGGTVNAEMFGAYTGGIQSTAIGSVVSAGERFDFRLVHEGSGTYKYWYRLTGGSWLQLGATLTGRDVPTNTATTADIRVFDREIGAMAHDATVEKVNLYSDATQTTSILAADFTDLAPGVTSFTEDSSNAATVTLAGNTSVAGGSNKWDVNRASSGLVTALVEEPVFVLDGVDDYFEVTDHANLNFGASQDFSVVIATRCHNLASQHLIGQRPTGWNIEQNATTLTHGRTYIRDGSANAGISDPPIYDPTNAMYVLSMVVDRTADTLTGYGNGAAGSAADISAVGDVSHANAIFIGRYGGGSSNYAPVEFTAAAIWRRALTDAEILEVYERLTETFMPATPTLRLEVAFDAGILDTIPVWTDITPYVYSVSYRRGRNFELNRFETGTLEIELDNNTGLFDPENTGAIPPYSGNIMPLKHIRLGMLDPSTGAGVETPIVFRGYIEAWIQSGYKRYTTRIRAADTLKALNGYRMGPRYQTAVMADDPIAFFLLDETTGTELKDSGSVGGDATLAGTGYALNQGSPYRDGGLGSSIDIDEDSTARATLPANTNLHDTSGGGYTVEAWVYLDSAKRAADVGISTLINLQNHTDPTKSNDVYFLEIDFGRTSFPYVYVRVPYGLIGLTNAMPTLDQWVHWAVVFTPAGYARFYHDGALVFTVWGGGLPKSIPDAGYPPVNYLFNDIDPPIGTGTNSFHGKVSGLALYNKALNDAAIAAHYEAGLDSFISQTLHARTVSALDHIGWPARRTLDTGAADPYHTLAATPLNNETAFQFLAESTESVGGEFFAAMDGDVVLRGRHWRAENQTTSLATFGDGAGEIGYSDLTFSIDDQYVATHVTATGANRTIYRVQGDEYDSTTDLRRDITLTAGHVDDLNITQARAEWYAHAYQTPRSRINSITFPPLASTAATTHAIYREIGDRITVTRRPPGGYTITADYYIESIRHKVARKMTEWETTWQLSPAIPTTDIALVGTDVVGSGASTDKVIGW